MRAECVIFRIGFDVIMTLTLQNTISRFKLFRIASFGSCVLLWRATKKNLLNVAAKNIEEHVQSYISNWLWHYDCNDSAKYHFQIQLILNWKFWELSVSLRRATQKRLLNVAAKEQWIAFSELSFELALALWLQWSCKIPFPDSTSFDLKVLISECVTLESHKTKQKSELSFELVSMFSLW